jgi:hypothetical protein
MFPKSLLVFAIWLVCGQALSQDVPAPSAKSLFEEGIALSQTGAWLDAAERFERSLALADRPATRINLVHAYAKLGRPLDLARHAIAFMELPAEPRRAEARAEAEQALMEASRSLARLSTDALPAEAVLLVDGKAPTARDSAYVYVLPGTHRLELLVSTQPSETDEVSLSAGETHPWPRNPPPVADKASAAEPIVPAVQHVAEVAAPTGPRIDTGSSAQPETWTRWRTRLAVTTGTLGASLALTSVATYALALHRARQIEDSGPFARGFLTDSNDYLRASNSVAPLAAAGGLLMAAAVATGPRSSRWGNRLTATGALTAGALLLGTAVFIIVRKPESVGDANLDMPSRQLGSVIAAFGAPLVSYGISFFVHRRRDAHGANHLSLSAGPR